MIVVYLWYQATWHIFCCTWAGNSVNDLIPCRAAIAFLTCSLVRCLAGTVRISRMSFSKLNCNHKKYYHMWKNSCWHAGCLHVICLLMLWQCYLSDTGRLTKLKLKKPRFPGWQIFKIFKISFYIFHLIFGFLVHTEIESIVLKTWWISTHNTESPSRFNMFADWPIKSNDNFTHLSFRHIIMFVEYSTSHLHLFLIQSLLYLSCLIIKLLQLLLQKIIL